MPKKKQVFEPENLESIRSAISGLIVEPPETIEPVVYSVDLLSRHDPYYPMVQGEATSRLAMTATRNMAINPITGDAVIEDEGFRAFFEGYDGLKIGLTVGAQKLLSTAALYLTQNNHYRPEESARIETEVQIPLISYARLLGYPVDERETATPEEAEKEKRRIKNLMKDVRGKINDQLDVLYSLSLSWSEKKGRVSDYQDVRLLQRKGVKRGSDIKLIISALRLKQRLCAFFKNQRTIVFIANGLLLTSIKAPFARQKLSRCTSKVVLLHCNGGINDKSHGFGHCETPQKRFAKSLESIFCL